MTHDSADEDLRIVRALLAGTDPAPSMVATAAERRQAQRLRRDLAVRLDPLSSPPGGSGRGRSVRRRPHRRWGRVLVASGVAVVAAVVLLVGISVVGGGQSAIASPLLPAPLRTATSGDHEGAVRVLHESARLQREIATAGTGPVHYTLAQVYALEVKVTRSDADTAATTRLVHTWRRPDGSRLVEQFLQDIDRAGRNIGGPRPESPRERRYEIPPVSADADVAVLPTDPDQLYAHLTSYLEGQRGGSVTSDDVTQEAFAYLKSGGANPQQKAALYDVLARNPAVFDAGQVTDRTGRAARSVGLPMSRSDSSVTVTGYLLLADDGTPLTAETVFSPDAPAGLRLPPGPAVAEYFQLATERQVSAVGDTR